MKIVINTCYGGYGLSDKAMRKLGIEDEDDIKRTDERLIKLVEKDPEGTSGDFAELAVVEIPDEATDYDFMEYDGVESIIYVVDGKIHYAD